MLTDKCSMTGALLPACTSVKTTEETATNSACKKRVELQMASNSDMMRALIKHFAETTMN